MLCQKLQSGFVDYLFDALLFFYRVISTKLSVIAARTRLPQTEAVGREIPSWKEGIADAVTPITVPITVL